MSFIGILPEASNRWLSMCLQRSATQLRRNRSTCHVCQRSFGTSQAVFAGHNKWSKTKHIKAVTDKKKMTERTEYTRTIAMYSRMYGDDLKFNPQLANAISAAAKASIPKSLIEAAVARGQGRSSTGAQLEPMSFEVLVPPDIALIADVETDNKNRSLHDIKHTVKKNGGVSGSTAFYFTRRGRAVFRTLETGITLSDVLEEALNHDGIEDVEETSDGAFIVWSEPSKLTSTTVALSSSRLKLETVDSDIMWAPNKDTRVSLDTPEAAEVLQQLCGALREYPEVKTLHANIRQGSVSDEEWESISRHLDV